MTSYTSYSPCISISVRHRSSTNFVNIHTHSYVRGSMNWTVASFVSHSQCIQIIGSPPTPPTTCNRQKHTLSVGMQQAVNSSRERWNINNILANCTAPNTWSNKPFAAHYIVSFSFHISGTARVIAQAHNLRQQSARRPTTTRIDGIRAERGLSARDIHLYLYVQIDVYVISLKCWNVRTKCQIRFIAWNGTMGFFSLSCSKIPKPLSCTFILKYLRISGTNPLNCWNTRKCFRQKHIPNSNNIRKSQLNLLSQ